MGYKLYTPLAGRNMIALLDDIQSSGTSSSVENTFIHVLAYITTNPRGRKSESLL